MRSENQVLLETKDLRKYFSGKKGLFNLNPAVVKAVDDINLTIHKGETLGLVGESGCGKSTLGRTILKLIPMTSGQVIYNGEDIAAYDKKQMWEMRKRMQIIFQDPYSSLNPRMTVYDLVSARLYDATSGEVRVFGHNVREYPFTQLRSLVSTVPQQASLVSGTIRSNLCWRDESATDDELWRALKLAQAADFVREKDRGLDAIVEAGGKNFSGGQRQRIGIARALILNPEFVVCDEAVSALDVSVRAQVLNLMKKMQQKRNLTYLFISHDLSVVRHVSDRVAVMYLGSVVEIADKQDLYGAPLHPYTRALLSAIPTTEEDNGGRERILLEGDIPSPVNPPSGCKFHTRCRYCQEKCKNEVPEWRDMGNHHYVACHFPLKQKD